MGVVRKKKKKKKMMDNTNEAPKEVVEGAEGVMGKRVYVGNLDWSVAWQDLKDHMRECGNVVYADVFKYDDGRSKGCGIVEYETVEEAAKAISTLNNTELNNRLVFVREDREDKELGGGRGRGGGRFRGGGGGGGFGGRGRGRGRGGGGAFAHEGEPTGSGRQIFVSN